MKMNQQNNPSCNTAPKLIWYLSPRRKAKERKKKKASLLNHVTQKYTCIIIRGLFGK
jgi:hypothetical protein